jgi:2,3-diketo-5-methylthio-1-phosphopentane phosphatase
VAIYSSGSELAQRRLFESTEHGDLTPVLSGFFDTGVGAKVASGSYGRIAAALGVPPAAILFVSDVTRELTAAREAGVHVVLSLRPGNSAQPDAEQFERVESFEELS